MVELGTGNEKLKEDTEGGLIYINNQSQASQIEICDKNNNTAIKEDKKNNVDIQQKNLLEKTESSQRQKSQIQIPPK